MISPEVVREVRSLLSKGRLSQRHIARSMGVSRGTVQAIASGRRPDYSTRRPRDRHDTIFPSGPPRRCPTCGGMVQMPCLLCHVRRIREARVLNRTRAH